MAPTILYYKKHGHNGEFTMNITNDLGSIKAQIWEEIKDLTIIVYSKTDGPITKIENGNFFLLSKNPDYFCSYGNPNDFYQGIADRFHMPIDVAKRKILDYKKRYHWEKQNSRFDAT